MNQRTILRSVLAAVLSLVATTATAYHFKYNGIYYNYNGDGTVSVTYNDSPTNEYTGDVVIPSSVTKSGKTYPVTSIGNMSFYECSGLTSVTIPNSVTSIGEYAFCRCLGLTSVTIPNSVTSIGNDAFANCTGLTSLAIPNSVTSIGETAFYRCLGLTSVTIPNSVTSIGDAAFSGCSGLTSVISKAVTPPTCGRTAFYAETTNSVPLIVPSVAKQAYKAAPIWSNFIKYAEPERKITAMEFGASTFGVGNGETLQLTAKVIPEDATFADVLQWTSSNEDVATVDSNGVVTAIAVGTATITAQTVDGSNLTAACVITVGTSAVEDVDYAAARIYSANGNIIIAAAEDGEAAVYDFTGRLIKSVPVVAGDNTAVPVMPGYYIVRTGVKTQSVVVK